MDKANPARIFGRGLRLLVGIGMLYSVYPYVLNGSNAYLTATALTIAGLVVFYTALHFAVAKYLPGINKWLGAVLAVIPVALVYLFVEPAGGLGSVIFIGASLIVVAVRGDGGCEVMAFPSLVVGKFTHLVCIAFSPIDWLEEKIAVRFQKAA